ncbi:pseudouridine synthase [Phlyctochytrium arcticum]|nr:pseudouridine synthase [Phlyctochytrium arcticum]
MLLRWTAAIRKGSSHYTSLKRTLYGGIAVYEFKRSSSIMTTDYHTWSKDELVAHIQKLEAAKAGPKIPQSTASTSHPHHQPPPSSQPIKHSQNKQKARISRPFDFSKHAFRPIALKVAYLGWDYHGLASQEADTVPTIESHLLHALTTAKLIPDRKTACFSRCGRTDKGVSGFEQVIGVWVRSALPVGKLGTVVGCVDAESAKAAATWKDDAHPGPILPRVDSTDGEMNYMGTLNRMLPPDIRILDWSPVGPEFDARFDCTSRRYKYFFPADNLNIRAMREAAHQYTGTHDFRNFCKVDPAKNIKSYERHVLDADIRPLGREDDVQWADGGDGLDSKGTASPDTFYVFTVTGHGFLWHQVRCMMAILFLIGAGKEPGNLPTILMELGKSEPERGRPAYDMAGELALVLVECGYAPGTFQWQAGHSETTAVLKTLRHLWKDHALKATQVARLIKGLTDQEQGLIQQHEWIDTSNVGGKSKGRYKPVLELPRCDSIRERIRKSDQSKEKKRGLPGTPVKETDAPLSVKKLKIDEEEVK